MPKDPSRWKFLRHALICLLMAGCSPATSLAATQPTASAAAAIPTLPATLTAAPQASPTPPPTETPLPAPRLCSPLQEIALQEMPGLISNPFHPPKPGYDDPHAGIDLAVRLNGSQVAVSGDPVQAAIAGQVAMVVQNRFPFGNALVIETPLEAFPGDWWSAAELPAPAPTLEPRSALTCPPGAEPSIADPSRRSLYILYAHLQEPPTLRLGDAVSCGQSLGTVGDSGNALNPHLHFEARVAPAGLRLTGMAHYDASATAEEMHSYCLWSVSGLFQIVDPQKVLRLAP